MADIAHQKEAAAMQPELCPIRSVIDPIGIQSALQALPVLRQELLARPAAILAPEEP